MFDLSGKVAAVAGGAGYLGVPVCTGLASQGATVVIGDINGERAAKATETVNDEVRPYAAKAAHVDLGDEESVAELIQNTVADFGRIDIAVVMGFAKSAKKDVENLTACEMDRSLSPQGSYCRAYRSRSSGACGPTSEAVYLSADGSRSLRGSTVLG